MPLRYRYQTVEFAEFDIHLRCLRDSQQFDPVDSAASTAVAPSAWAFFGLLWDSGRVLSHCMSQRPGCALRVLEVGCGIGLASMVLHKRGWAVTASDYHPQAGHFLQENLKLNQAQPMRFVVADWSQDYPELGQFDLIIGSDVLYEPDHAKLLSEFIRKHAASCCEVVLVDARRGWLNGFARMMEQQGFTVTRAIAPETPGVSAGYRGHVLNCIRGPVAAASPA